MTHNKTTVIQHCVNPAILPTHIVHYVMGDTLHSVSGQVLFFTAHGGHWTADDRHHRFVGIYDADDGALVALLNMRTVVQIVRSED